MTLGACSHKSTIDTLTVRLSTEPQTLDWNRAHTPFETHLLSNLMEGLLSYNSKMEILPQLAQSWTVSRDHKTYTFKLRPGVLWSDGVPLTAEHFVTSWKRLLSPQTAAPYAYLLFDIVGAKAFAEGRDPSFSHVGIQALSETEIQVRLDQPVAHWLHILTFWVTFPLREDLAQNHFLSQAGQVTVGPYVLSQQSDPMTHFTLEANPHYWGTALNQGPHFKRAVFQIVKDNSTALNLYDSKHLNILTDLPAYQVEQLEAEKGKGGAPDFRTFPYLKTLYLGFNHNREPLNRPSLRKAIAQGLDRSTLQPLLKPGQSIATSFVPAGMPGHLASAQIGLPFNLKEAQRALAVSGLKSGDSIDLLLLNHEKSLLIGQWIQAELKKNLGLQIRLQAFDNKTFRSALDRREYPLFLTSWSADYPDADNFVSLFLSESGNNRIGLKNPEFDRMVLSARQSSYPLERIQKYFEIQKFLLQQDIGLVPLHYDRNTALVQPELTGFEINPLNVFLLKNVRRSSNETESRKTQPSNSTQQK